MIALLVPIVVVGLVIWALNLLPLPEPFKQVILVIGILFVILLFLQFLGVHTGLTVPSIR